ncbi:MAG: hypothetical protein M0Q51_02775 [Bacteroidales bacterium]|nr:hypothetical protein [Bacteroidales bacterium]
MKKIFIILIMMMIGSSMTSAQSIETGYVTVTWTEVTPCCIPMKYYVCITIMRVSDRVAVVENLCEVVDVGNDHYQFVFEFPCSTSNEEFQVFATVRAGCEGTPPCDNGKNPGTLADCEDLTSGSFTIVGDYDY